MTEHFFEPRLLFILSSESPNLPNGKRTGVYLPELAHLFEIIHKDFTIEFASTEGGAISMDENSLEAAKVDGLCQQFLARKGVTSLLFNTKVIEECRIRDYAGIVLPGGHGPMFDLPNHRHMNEFIAEALGDGIPVVAVCHGVAGLVNAKTRSGAYVVEGKHLTCFSDDEERVLHLENFVPFLLESKLKERGAIYTKADETWAPHVVVDGNLFTGQNPASAVPLAETFRRHMQSKYAKEFAERQAKKAEE